MTKPSEELRRELLQRELSGEFNSLEKKEDGFSNASSIGVTPLEQMRSVTDKVIVDSKLQNSNQRESTVVGSQKINSYEAFLESLNSKTG